MSRPTSPSLRVSTLSRRQLLAAGGALTFARMPRALLARTPVVTPRPPSMLRIAVGSLPQSYDPLAAVSLEDTWLTTLLYDSVARWNAEGAIFPSLGLGWSVTGYGRVIDITLRPGAYFPDGKPLVADDVRWSLERIRNRDDADPGSWRLEHVWRIQSLDPETVRIILDAPDASLVSSLAAPALSVLAETTNPPNFRGGTGPFEVSSRSHDLVTFQPNRRFWQVGRPRFDMLRVRQIPDDTERSTALVTGMVDLVPNAPLLDIPMLQADPSVRLVGGPSSQLCLLHANLAAPEMQDVRIRRLLAAAIDRPRLVQVATAGQAEASSLLLPEGSWARGEVKEVERRSPEEIRAGLAELGIRSDVRLHLITNNADATLANTAIVLQEQLAYCGISLSVALLEADELEEAIATGDYDLLAGYTRPWRDPHELVRPLLSSGGIGNYAGYANPEVDGLIRGATMVTDREARAERYTRLQERIHADVPVIVLFRPHYFDAMTQRLSGYAVLPPVTGRGLLPATLDPVTR